MTCAALTVLVSGLAIGAEPPVRAQNLKGARSNQVPGIKPFSSDESSMALNALGTCLGAYNYPVLFQRLVFLSGAAFTFVYDTTEAYEPLGDLYPVDLLGAACSNLGFQSARWYTGGSIEEVKALIKGQIDDGHPVIAPFLNRDTDRGFFLVVGYDFDSNVFYIQGRRRDSTYSVTPIPEHWTGPTASPAGWADNPVFVVGPSPGQGVSDQLLDREVIARGIGLLEGGRLAYGNNPGERAFIRTPGPHEAAYGLPAYRLLSSDVGGGQLIVDEGGGEEVNLGLIWRINNQLEQLEEYRNNAGGSIALLARVTAGANAFEVEDLADNLRKTSADAGRLRRMFWDMIPHNVGTPDSIVKYVNASRSMVFSFAGYDKYFQDLEDRGLHVYKTRSGPVIVQDLPEKRLDAKILAKSLEARERSSLAAMKEVLSYIGPEPESKEAPAPAVRPRLREGGKEGAKEPGKQKAKEGNNQVGE